MWYQCVLRADMDRIVVGEASNIQDGTVVHVDAGRPALIGARVGIGHRAIIHGCEIEDECLVGMGSVLLNGARVGTGSVVAAGAVVTEGVVIPPGSLVVTDAGFVGFDLCRSILQQGHSFLLRVGGNLTLLSTLCGTRDQLDAAGRVLARTEVPLRATVRPEASVSELLRIPQETIAVAAKVAPTFLFRRTFRGQVSAGAPVEVTATINLFVTSEALAGFSISRTMQSTTSRTWA